MKRWVSEASCLFAPHSEWVGERVSMCFCVMSIFLLCSYALKKECLVLVTLCTIPCICLSNKANFLLCMGMRLSLPASAYFYGNRRKENTKNGKMTLKRESQSWVCQDSRQTNAVWNGICTLYHDCVRERIYKYCWCVLVMFTYIRTEEEIMIPLCNSRAFPCTHLNNAQGCTPRHTCVRDTQSEPHQSFNIQLQWSSKHTETFKHFNTEHNLNSNNERGDKNRVINKIT